MTKVRSRQAGSDLGTESSHRTQREAETHGIAARASTRQWGQLDAGSQSHRWWCRHGVAPTLRSCLSGSRARPFGRRLPRRRRGGHGNGFRRRTDRPRRRARGHGRPARRRRWPLAPRVPVRATAPVLDLLRRRVAGARRRSDPDHGTGGRAARARGPADHLRLLRAGAGRADGRPGTRRVLSRLRLRGRSHLRLARLRRALRSARPVPSRRRPLPRARHPGGDAAEVRGSRRRARRSGQRPSRLGGDDQPVRRRGLGQDRDGRLRLAAGPRRRPRRDLLGAAARPLDAEPVTDPAGPGHLPGHGGRDDAPGGRGQVAAGALRAAGGRRHHAADRPIGDPDDGQGADPGDVGARPAAQHRARRPARPPPGGPARPAGPGGGIGRGGRRRAGRELCRRRSEEPAAGPDLGFRRDHAAARPGRLPLLRGRSGRIRRGHPRRRRREEPSLPAVLVRELAGRLGPDERPGRPQHRRLLRRAGHQAVDRPNRREPRTDPARAPGLPRVWTTPWAGWAATSAPVWRGWPSSAVSRPERSSA